MPARRQMPNPYERTAWDVVLEHILAIVIMDYYLERNCRISIHCCVT